MIINRLKGCNNKNIINKNNNSKKNRDLNSYLKYGIGKKYNFLQDEIKFKSSNISSISN